MRKSSAYGRITFCVATSGLLLLLWTALAAGSPPGKAQAYQPLAIPDIRGSYAGQDVATIICSVGTATSTSPTSTIIPSQQGQSFSGSAFDGQIVFSGTVDSSGKLTGTYSLELLPVTGGGTFTGQASGDQLQLNLTGKQSFPPDCDFTHDITATRTLSEGPKADLSITGTASPSPVAGGTRITYALTVTNAGPDAANNVLITQPTPDGITFADARTSQGQIADSGSGAEGNILYSLGTLGVGASATVSFTGNVLAPAGSTLANSPFVTSSTPDPNIDNNSVTISTPVLGGAIVKLVWDARESTPDNPTPSPANLRMQIGSAAAEAQESEQAVAQQACTLISVKVYKSDQPNVQPIPGNLWQSVSPNLLRATLAAAPSGSFYVITNLWKCGEALTESAASNEIGLPAGPTVSSVKLSGKMKIRGSGFTEGAEVFVDGLAFSKSTKLTDSTQLVQKGALIDGTLIGDIGATRAVLITVKNGNGGLGSFTFRQP
jgi:uncharacterized repeat protein (TIGR01451 family)